MAKAIKVHKDSEIPTGIRIKEDQFILMNKVGFHKYLKETEFKRTIKLVQNHHTYKPDYSNFNGDDHFDDLKAMDRYHENKRGWSDIGQNITIFPDGMIGICRPINKAPAGIKGANKHGICIEAYGNFDKGGDEMTKAQRDSILFVNAVLCHKFKLIPDSNTIVYHHWWNWSGKRTNGVDGKGKSCPGTNFFGGNKVEDAENNFIPLINDKLEILKKI
jgi:hypothetical protein